MRVGTKHRLTTPSTSFPLRPPDRSMPQVGAAYFVSSQPAANSRRICAADLANTALTSDPGLKEQFDQLMLKKREE